MLPKQWTWLLCSVSVISVNKLPLKELTQRIRIKLLISRFPKIFPLSPNFQGGGQIPVSPPPADAHGFRWELKVSNETWFRWEQHILFLGFKFSECKLSMSPERRNRTWSHFFGTGARVKKSDSAHLWLKCQTWSSADLFAVRSLTCFVSKIYYCFVFSKPVRVKLSHAEFHLFCSEQTCFLRKRTSLIKTPIWIVRPNK